MESKQITEGWRVRCTKCDCTEPWDKPVGRMKAGGRKYIYGRCPNCKRIRLRVIEPLPDPLAPKA